MKKTEYEDDLTVREKTNSSSWFPFEQFFTHQAASPSLLSDMEELSVPEPPSPNDADSVETARPPSDPSADEPKLIAEEEEGEADLVEVDLSSRSSSPDSMVLAIDEAINILDPPRARVSFFKTTQYISWISPIYLKYIQGPATGRPPFCILLPAFPGSTSPSCDSCALCATSRGAEKKFLVFEEDQLKLKIYFVHPIFQFNLYNS